MQSMRPSQSRGRASPRKLHAPRHEDPIEGGAAKKSRKTPARRARTRMAPSALRTCPRNSKMSRERVDPATIPLVRDATLPVTHENLSLPPAVEAHTVAVVPGTVDDYQFDLERQQHLQRDEVTQQHTEYLESHPELKDIVSDLLTSILADKPSDVYSYAAEYFSATAPPPPGM